MFSILWKGLKRLEKAWKGLKGLERACKGLQRLQRLEKACKGLFKKAWKEWLVTLLPGDAGGVDELRQRHACWEPVRARPLLSYQPAQQHGVPRLWHAAGRLLHAVLPATHRRVPPAPTAPGSSPPESVLWIDAGKANLPRLFWLAIQRHVRGFYEATQRLSCKYTSAELTQFDGRARGDDVMGNLTVSLLRA